MNDPVDNLDPDGLDFLSCMANCIQSKDPLNNLGKGAALCLGPLPKKLFGNPRSLGSGPFQTILSELGLGGGPPHQA